MIIAYHILLMLLYVIRLYVKYYYNIYIYKAFLYSIILAMLAMITWGGRPAVLIMHALVQIIDVLV
jgi:hypothetical protein